MDEGDGAINEGDKSSTTRITRNGTVVDCRIAPAGEDEWEDGMSNYEGWEM